jgi:hypothetical protein
MRRGVNRRNKSSVPTFMDSRCYAYQNIDKQSIYTEYLPLSTNSSGDIQASVGIDPSTLVPKWPEWGKLYEKYRIVSVTAELRAVQGTTQKGITAFWFDPDGSTTSTLQDASSRRVTTHRNNCLSSSKSLSYVFKEIDDLSYQQTSAPIPFVPTTFHAYTDSPVFDSTTNTQLWLVRFKYVVVFKNLRG